MWDSSKLRNHNRTTGKSLSLAPPTQPLHIPLPTRLLLPLLTTASTHRTMNLLRGRGVANSWVLLWASGEHRPDKLLVTLVYHIALHAHFRGELTGGL